MQTINEYLQIPQELIKDYAELISDQNKLDDHFNWRKFAHNSDTNAEQDLKDYMIQIDEFNVQKTHSKQYKMMFLYKFRNLSD